MQLSLFNAGVCNQDCGDPVEKYPEVFFFFETGDLLLKLLPTPTRKNIKYKVLKQFALASRHNRVLWGKDGEASEPYITFNSPQISMC